MIKIEPKNNIPYYEIDKYTIQGFIYSLLRENSQFSNLHDTVGFKFFNFSNIFPVSDFEKNSLKKLIISSTNNELIKLLFNQLKNINSFKLKNYTMELLKVNILKKYKCSKFISATPIVLFKDNKNNKYFSFKQYNDVSKVRNEMIHYKVSVKEHASRLADFKISQMDASKVFSKSWLQRNEEGIKKLVKIIAGDLGYGIKDDIPIVSSDGMDPIYNYVYKPYD